MKSICVICFGLRCCVLVRQLLPLNVVYITFKDINESFQICRGGAGLVISEAHLDSTCSLCIPATHSAFSISSMFHIGVPGLLLEILCVLVSHFRKIEPWMSSCWELLLLRYTEFDNTTVYNISMINIRLWYHFKIKKARLTILNHFFYQTSIIDAVIC